MHKFKKQGEQIMASNKKLFKEVKLNFTKETYERGTLVSKETKEVSGEFYNNYVGAKGIMKSFGGTESHFKNYTSEGYIVTKITSNSPDRNTKIKAYFEILRG